MNIKIESEKIEEQYYSYFLNTITITGSKSSIEKIYSNLQKFTDDYGDETNVYLYVNEYGEESVYDYYHTGDDEVLCQNAEEDTGHIEEYKISDDHTEITLRIDSAEEYDKHMVKAFFLSDIVESDEEKELKIRKYKIKISELEANIRFYQNKIKELENENGAL